MHLEQVEHKLDLEKLLQSAHLDTAQEYVVKSRFGLAHNFMTLNELASERGVSRERTRQIEAKALRKLRAAARRLRLKVIEPGQEYYRATPKPISAPKPQTEHAPGEITVHCDACRCAFGTRIYHRGGAFAEANLKAARNYLREQGWRFSPTQDLCPRCK